MYSTQVDRQFSQTMTSAAGFPKPLGAQVAVDPSDSPFGASLKASCHGHVKIAPQPTRMYAARGALAVAALTAPGDARYFEGGDRFPQGLASIRERAGSREEKTMGSAPVCTQPSMKRPHSRTVRWLALIVALTGVLSGILAATTLGQRERAATTQLRRSLRVRPFIEQDRYWMQPYGPSLWEWLQQGADPTLRVKHPRAPIDLDYSVMAAAAEVDDLRPLKWLIERGHSVNNVDGGGRSALYYAVGAPDGSPAVPLLLQHRADHGGRRKNWSALRKAVIQDCPINVELLLKHGVDPSETVEGETLIHYARRNGFKRVARLLAEYSAAPGGPQP